MAGVEENNVALLDEAPVISPGQTFDSVTDTITDAVLKRPIGLGWLAGLAIGMTLLAILGMAVTYLFLRGVGRPLARRSPDCGSNRSRRRTWPKRPSSRRTRMIPTRQRPAPSWRECPGNNFRCLVRRMERNEHTDSTLPLLSVMMTVWIDAPWNGSATTS